MLGAGCVSWASMDLTCRSCTCVPQIFFQLRPGDFRDLDLLIMFLKSYFLRWFKVMPLLLRNECQTNSFQQNITRGISVLLQ